MLSERPRSAKAPRARSRGRGREQPKTIENVRPKYQAERQRGYTMSWTPGPKDLRVRSSALIKHTQTATDNWEVTVMANCIVGSLHYPLPAIATPGPMVAFFALPGLPNVKFDMLAPIGTYTGPTLSDYGQGFGNPQTTTPAANPTQMPTILDTDAFRPLAYDFSKGRAVLTVSLEIPADDVAEYTVFFDPCNPVLPVKAYKLDPTTGTLSVVDELQVEWNNGTPYHFDMSMHTWSGPMLAAGKQAPPENEVSSIASEAELPAPGPPAPLLNQLETDVVNLVYLGGCDMSVRHTNPTAFTKTSWRVRTDTNIVRRPFDIMGEIDSSNPFGFLVGYQEAHGADAAYRGTKWGSAHQWLSDVPGSLPNMANTYAALQHAFTIGLPMIQFKTTNVTTTGTSSFQFTVEANAWIGYAPLTSAIAASMPFMTEPQVMPTWASAVRSSGTLVSANGAPTSIGVAAQSYRKLSKALPGTTPLQRAVAVAEPTKAAMTDLVAHPAVEAAGNNSNTFRTIANTVAGVGKAMVEGDFVGALTSGATGLAELLGFL